MDAMQISSWKQFLEKQSGLFITEHTISESFITTKSGIAIIGAVLATVIGGTFGMWLGFVAVVFAMINVVCGFMVTDRMLKMFKKKK